MLVGNNESATTKNAGKLLVISIAMRTWQCNAGVHCPMEHILGFTRSHWMPPLGECPSRIAPAAAMVNEFVGTTQITNKTQLLASDYRTFLLVKAI